MFWIPMAQAEEVYILAHVEYLVRTASSQGGIAAAMREVVQRVDPDVPTGTIASMDEAVLDTMGERLFETRILTVFALMALLLAGVGIFGVTAYAVNERLPELGIRLALGAEATQVAADTLRGVGVLILPGLVAGSVCGVAGGRVLSASLYQVAPMDLVTLVGVTLLIGGVALLSAALPARRASRVDPARLLRAE
jgi:ABC-type antimicrobial peptide transport system permease subunit